MSRTPLTRNHVEAVLKAIGVLYPEQHLDDLPENQERVRLIAAQYYEDCEHIGMSAEEFTAAVKHCRRESRHFPRIPQIIEAHRFIVTPKHRRFKALPQRTTADMDEQRDRNLEGCARMRELLRRVTKPVER